MNKKDISPPGREEQVRALKNTSVDNPFAVAWASYNKSHDDVGAEDFQHVVTPDTLGEPPQLDLPPGVATPRSGGHMGSEYTYGQRRGEAPGTTESLEQARDREEYPMDDDDRKSDDDDVKALKSALDDDDARHLDDYLDDSDDDDRHSDDDAKHDDDSLLADDDDNYLDDDDDAGDPLSAAHATVAKSAHKGLNGDPMSAHGDDDEDPDHDGDVHDDEGMDPPGHDYATQLQATMAAQEVAEKNAVLKNNKNAQPKPSDPPVNAKPSGTSSGAIKDVPVVGQNY